MESGFHPYLKPRLHPTNLDRYHVRKSILAALLTQLEQFHGVFLDVGCGSMPYRPLLLQHPSRIQTYIGLDIPGINYAPPDLYWNGKLVPIRSETVDSAMATEVLEHCPRPIEVLSEVYRVLKPGGVFFLTVPFLWPLHDVPFDEYRYTPFALEKLLGDAGFSDINLSSLGGWDASLAQLIGLWVQRRPMSDGRRRLLRYLAFPVIANLLNHDRPPTEFSEGTMISGIFGTAIRAKA